MEDFMGKKWCFVPALFCMAVGLFASVMPAHQSRDEKRPRLRATTQKMREEAAQRKALQHDQLQVKFTPAPGGQPNYFGPESNYANSPLPILKHHRVTQGSGMRKFVDSLPGLGYANRNNLGQYIPVATPNTTKFSGADYYEIGAVQYLQRMHSDLPHRTTLRGFVQLNTGANAVDPVGAAHYLGPMIIARKHRPVRIKFSNLLPTGGSGNLFLPVDTTVMGAGVGPDMVSLYPQNRVVLHLHGGATPWISDGTPHQWITPAGEPTTLQQGVSVQPVPDMLPLPVVGDGTATYFYPNEQSSRLMWYHDHSYGITRVNVYAGLVAPYLLTDSREERLIKKRILPNAGGNYRYGIPLIIQDKTFIPPRDQLQRQDPTWNYFRSVGSLWFPHVYMPNQNPNDPCGCSDIGRWDYGPWFWPPTNGLAGLQHGPILDPNGSGLTVPGTPNPSLVPEAFMDTPVVNGAPYPYLDVDRRAYRFRILNGSNDRTLNLQLYYAEPLSVSVVSGGSGYTEAPKVVFKGKADSQAKATAVVSNGQVIAVNISDYGSGYSDPPRVKFIGGGKHAKGAHAVTSLNTEVKMVPASPSRPFPSYWPTPDGRAGGFPDPATAGPSMIQIGTEGGFLPNPVVLPNTPIGYQYNRRDIVVLNVLEKTLLMGPAERADVIIDFSQVPKNVSTVILYNDAPAPVPAFDPRYDYYTNNPDLTSTGGAPSTIAGYGPNTRTIMQFRLSHKTHRAFNLAKLQRALPKAFAASQPAPIVPESTYPAPYKAATNTYSSIQANTLTFTPFNTSTPITQLMLPKAIQELFELNYGRMNAILGSELPFTNDGTQTTVPLGYRDPPVENLAMHNESQIWKITHNGVDTHAIHFHLFNVQLINRVGWDGTIRPPDANELGWKETVRMNPLEDTIVALRPVTPTAPFAVPNSVRPLDPTMMLGMTWQTFNPATGAQSTITNSNVDFGWEYVWHCHLLGHEENDMMRPITFGMAPTQPLNVQAVAGPGAGQAVVSFSPPASAGMAGPVVSYIVSPFPTNADAALPAPVTGVLASPVTISGLQTGISYSFVVTAVTATSTGIADGNPVPYLSQPSLVSNSVVAP